MDGIKLTHPDSKSLYTSSNLDGEKAGGLPTFFALMVTLVKDGRESPETRGHSHLDMVFRSVAL